MRNVTIEIWSTKSHSYDCTHSSSRYTIWEKENIIRTYEKSYNTDNYRRAMGYAKTFLKKIKRGLHNHEATVIKVK